MIGFRKRLVATLVWIACRCTFRRDSARTSALADSRLPASKESKSHSTQAARFKLAPPPISFRRLEPRRVLSVNATFAAGVLNIEILAAEGSTDASLMSDGSTHFFVDANGNQTYDAGAGELQGLLAQLNQVQVVGDAGIGNFSWRSDFSLSPLGAPSGNAVEVSQVANIDLSATASVAGNVSLSAAQSIQLGGELAIQGDLNAQTASPSGQIANIAGGSLEVAGHTDLSAHAIDLGNQAGDQLSLNSLTITSDGAVDISEDGSATDIATQLTGANTANLLHLSNNGSITLANGATITVDGELQLSANGVDADLDVDGSITSINGNVDLLASNQVTLGSSASMMVGGNGALSIGAQGSGIDLTDGSQLSVDQGSVFLSATGVPGAEIHLSQISSGSGSTATFTVEATGDILDGTAGEAANISAPTGTLVLRSLNGSIGADPGNAAGDIDIDVQNLQFQAGAALGTVHVTDLAGGLRIHAVSQSGASAIVSALSPLVIAANVNVGASSTFTAGDSPLAGDNLTIENAAIVTLTSVATATLTFNAGDDIVFLNGGQIVTAGGSHEVILNADRDHAGVGAADGDRGSITQNTPATVEVTTNLLTAVAAGQIDLDTLVDILDARSTDMGDISIRDGSSIQLDHVETTNGSIEVSAVLNLLALNVHAVGSVGLQAGGDIDQPGSVWAASDVQLDAGGNYVQSGNTIAGSTIQVITGGSQRLGLLSAGQISLDAGGDILDNNGADVLNLRATTLRMVAGGIIGGPDVATPPAPPTLPDTNRNALDMQVGTVAALSSRGIYLQELASGGDLTIGHADGLALPSLDDLETTAGPIKVVVRGGDLIITDGNDGDDVGVSALGVHDILLAASHDVLITADIPIGAKAQVLSGGGHVTLYAGNDVVIDSAVSTVASGTIYVSGGNDVTVNAMVTNVDGNQLFTATRDVSINAPVSSSAGSIGLMAGRDVQVNSTVTTANGNLLLSSGLDLNINSNLSTTTGSIGMSAGQDISQFASINAGGDVLAVAGRDFTQIGGTSITAGLSPVVPIRDTIQVTTGGTQRLGLLSATHISLDAGGDILDYNDQIVADQVNLRATTLRMVAGGIIGEPDPASVPDSNVQALDLEVGTVAALSTRGIYLQELIAGGNLVVGHAEGQVQNFGPVGVRQVHFNSTTSPVPTVGVATGSALKSLDDLETTAGPIKVVVRGGDLIITDGNDGDDVGVSASGVHDILLAASHDVLITVDIPLGAKAQVLSGGGHVTLYAGNDVVIDSAVSTVASGTIYVSGGNDVTVNAMVTNIDGNQLFTATRDVSINAPVSSSAGSIGLMAGRDVQVNSTVTTANGNLLLSSGLDLNINSNLSTTTGSIGMSAGQDISQFASIDAGGDVLAVAGRDFTQIGGTSITAGLSPVVPIRDTIQVTTGGTQRLGLLSATHISLDAGGDILDYNDQIVADQVNLRATTLRMVAGGIIGEPDPASVPDSNVQALDLEVGTVAALSTRGIYLQELIAGGNLVVGHAEGQVQNFGPVGVRQVHFNSTTSPVPTVGVATGSALKSLDDLETTAGPIKVVVRGGDLIITDGNDGDDVGVSASGVHDILLAASHDVLITVDIPIGAKAQVLSGGGHVTLYAGNDVVIDSAVSTVASGTIYVSGGNDVTVNAMVTNVDGNQLFTATRDVSINAPVSSSTGSIGLMAGRDVQVNSTVTTANGNLLLSSGLDLNINSNLSTTTGSIGMSAGQDISQFASINAGGDVLAVAGRDFTQIGGTSITAGLSPVVPIRDTIQITTGGTQRLGLLSATHISLDAGGDILDYNDQIVADQVNLRATTLRMMAGGIIGEPDPASVPDSNVQALDLEVGTVAALSTRGIYLQELIAGGNLVVGHAEGQVQNFGPVGVRQVHFNSTTSPVPTVGVATGSALKSLDDLETTAGPIKVVVRGGDLIITDGNDGDDVGVSASGVHDILLAASHDVLITVDIPLGAKAQVLSGGGHVTLYAGNDVVIDSAVSTVASGTIYVSGGNDVTVNAMVTNVDGNQLFTATRDLSINAPVSSSAGSIGLMAGRDVQVNSTVTTANGNLLLSSGLDLNINSNLSTTTGSIGMSAGQDISQFASIDAGGDVLAVAGRDFTQIGGTSITAGLSPVVPIRDTIQVTTGGTQRLGLLSATHISLDAGGDILDYNDQIVADQVNLRATTLRMVAGGIIGEPDPASVPDSNVQALDLEVGTVARALSTRGIYLQELIAGGNLVVGHAEGQVQNFGPVGVRQVHFNSTTSPVPTVGVATGSALKSLDDLETTAGPIKVVVRGGDLIITDGNDGDDVGVSASGVHDILLAASHDVLITVDIPLGAKAQVLSGGGHVTLYAGNDVVIDSAVSTVASGTIYVSGGNDVTVNAMVTNVDGDQLFTATRDVSINAAVTSGAGSIGLMAGRDVQVNSTVTTANGNLLLSSGLDLNINSNLSTTTGSIGMSAGQDISQFASIDAGGDVLAVAGRDFTQIGGTSITAGLSPVVPIRDTIQVTTGGTQRLGLLSATHISLDAGGDILDYNDQIVADQVNLRATTLRMVAGGIIGEPDPASVPDSNVQALDLEVGTVAALSTRGIYLQELIAGGNLVVGHAEGQVQNFGPVGVRQVHFNSTTSPVPTVGVATGSALKSLDDLETTAGPIKVVVRGGDLIITDGNDGDDVGVSALGVHDILLAASHDVLITVDIPLGAKAQVLSGGGHVTLYAGNDVVIDSAVSTVASGTIYVSGGNDVTVNAMVTNVDGDQLFTATRDVSINAAVTSGAGSIGLMAGRDVQVNSTVSTASGNLLLTATRDLNINSNLSTTTGSVGMSAGQDISQFASINAGGDVLAVAGRDFTQIGGTSITAGLSPVVPIRDTIQVTTGGTQRLGLLSATHISLDAGGDILDYNDQIVADQVNLRATTLRMVAGGIIGEPDPASVPDSNVQALDLEVGTVAALSTRGIYLQELIAGGNLVVGHAEGQVQNFGPVGVRQVHFNSTTSPVPTVGVATGSALKSLDDLETTAGPIKVVVRGGDLIITDGEDGDDVGVSASGVHDILLAASHDVLITVDIPLGAKAQVLSGGGHVTLYAGNDVVIDSAVSTVASGTIYVSGGNDVTVNAMVTNVDGNQLFTATRDLSINAPVSSSAGSIGLMADRDIFQTADITAGSDVLIAAGGNFTQSGGVRTTAGAPLPLTSGHTLQVITGGTQLLDRLTASHISLDAGGDILANNDQALGDVLNLQATTLRMVAGGTIGESDLPTLPTPINAADFNRNAIDMQVDTVAARSRDGIYLQELAAGGDLIVGHAEGFASVSVQQVHFNSTISPVTAGDGDPRPLDDLETTAGPIKVVVRGGDLVITDGKDGDDVGASALGVHDILLAASHDVLITVDMPMGTKAEVLSGGGHVTLYADNDVVIDSAVSTVAASGAPVASGTIYVTGGNDIRTTGNVSNQNGDMLFEAGHDLFSSGNINSLSGNVAFIIGSDLTHSGSVSTGGNVIVDVGRDLNSGSGSIAAGDYLLISTGSDSLRGTQTLGSLEADLVLLEASGDIFDGNADALNVKAIALQMTAGRMPVVGMNVAGIGTHADPIDTAVGTIAARSDHGIYLRQLQSVPSLTIGHVDAGSASVSLKQVHFNSSTSDIGRTLSVTGLDDLETNTGRAPGEAAIEVQVIDGDLIVTNGQDADNRGVLVSEKGAIVLQTTLAGNIALQTGVETKGLGEQGRITLDAFGAIRELASVNDVLVSDATVVGRHLTIKAGTYAHLHNVEVDTLTAYVGANGTLDGAWQQTNAKANDKGDDFLDQLGADRQSFASSAGVMDKVDPSSNTPQLSDGRTSYDNIARQFRFEDTYRRQYALFVQNTKNLEVMGVTAGADSDMNSATAMPTVYIETLNPDPKGAAFDLTVTGTIGTHSSNATEGGIVLVAGGKLLMNGTLQTESKLSDGVFRTQRIENIGSGVTTNAMGQAAVAYLDAHVFNGGEGLTPQNPLLTSTEFVIRDQVGGLSALAETYRTHVFQRVVAQYGFQGEAGFVTFVGYADGEIQQFDVAGDSGSKTKTSDPTNINDQSSLQAAPQATAQTAGQATAFSRTTAFDPQFLNANQDLPTTAIARRAADFFLFENASALQASDIHDMTVQSFPVTNVSALGAQGATEMPPDAAPVQPPAAGTAVAPPLLANPVQLVRNDVELQAIQARSIEVAIYRVYYDDLNQNGQADENELPSEQDILEAKEINVDGEANESAEVESKRRRKVDEVKTEAGGSPTAEDIEEKKNEFLNDPQRPSGAYAIIERGLDDKEIVLDVFSVRDIAETGADAPQPLIQLPSQVDAENSTKSPTSEPDSGNLDSPTEQTARPAAEDSSQYSAPGEAGILEAEQGFQAARNESRFAHAGLIAASLSFVRHIRQSDTPQNASVLPIMASSERVEFGRRARRRRRFQRQELATRSPHAQDRSSQTTSSTSNSSVDIVPTSNGDSL